MKSWTVVPREFWITFCIFAVCWMCIYVAVYMEHFTIWFTFTNANVMQRIRNINYYFVLCTYQFTGDELVDIFPFHMSFDYIWNSDRNMNAQRQKVLEPEVKEIYNQGFSLLITTYINGSMWWWCNDGTGHWPLEIEANVYGIESKSQITIVSYSMLWLDFQISNLTQQNTFKLFDRFCYMYLTIRLSFALQI